MIYLFFIVPSALLIALFVGIVCIWNAHTLHVLRSKLRPCSKTVEKAAKREGLSYDAEVLDFAHWMLAQSQMDRLRVATIGVLRIKCGTLKAADAIKALPLFVTNHGNTR